MSLAGEIRAGLRGAMRLFFWDKDAFEEFDISADGFWRSFTAPIMIIPIFYLFYGLHYNLAVDLSILHRGADGSDFITGRSFVWHRIAMNVVGIVVLPLALIPMSRLLQFKQRYVHFVIAMNWGQVVILGLYFFPVLLYGLGLFTAMVAGNLLALMIIVSLIYELAIVRFASGLNIFVSALILAILGLINQILKLLIDLL